MLYQGVGGKEIGAEEEFIFFLDVFFNVPHSPPVECNLQLNGLFIFLSRSVGGAWKGEMTLLSPVPQDTSAKA